ncbi:TadE family type IV pilus minor pilin [Propionicicella superfundia]|uniref:TadE family type IV pilus minor pilin n=1 Tax=Propionicicella superfundia TaxID=348582 RepID=UPI000421701B|nr:TadE family type IV pilus minor pilin [Propionicicella superfundia]
MSAGGHRRDERGMVTAEIAAGTLLVAAMAVVMAWVGGVIVLQQRVNDSAVQIARQQARGDTESLARARAAAPEGSVVEIAREKGEYVVTVRCRPQAPVRWLAGPEVSGTARVQAEPGQT